MNEHEQSQDRNPGLVGNKNIGSLRFLQRVGEITTAVGTGFFLGHTATLTYIMSEVLKEGDGITIILTASLLAMSVPFTALHAGASVVVRQRD